MKVWLRAVVVGGVMTAGVCGGAASAGASVTWTHDPATQVLTMRATAGEPLVIQCGVDGRVRTVLGVKTTASCASLSAIVLEGSAANDVLDMTAMTAALFPALTRTTANGKAGNDRIEGSPAADTLLGGGGDDRIKGGDGDDAVQGNSGNDKLAGEGGADTVAGGDGDDKVAGGSDSGGQEDLAKDELTGGLGVDAVVARDSDSVQNRTVDVGGDIVRWGFSPTARAYGFAILSTATSRVDLFAPRTGTWSVVQGTDCGCEAYRESAAAGAPRATADIQGFSTFTMTAGDDIFNLTLDENWPSSVVGIDGGLGADTLKIRVPDPAKLTLTATDISYPSAVGFGNTISYSGFETVKVIVTPPLG